MQSKLKIFYSSLFITTFIPYLSYIFPFFPKQILGFTITGWAWIIMLMVTLLSLISRKKIEFPIILWLPWVLYIVVYLIIDFSFLGLQLTFQYALPLFVGVVASGFAYDEEDLYWIFKRFVQLCVLIYVLFVYGYLFRGGYTFGSSGQPMLYSVLVSLLAALYYINKNPLHIFVIAILFMAAVIDNTRMGIAVTVAVCVFHFANTNLNNKIIFGSLGIMAFLAVFYSKSFQEKTFYSGHGSINDLTLNYYDNPDVRSSGRISWKKALEPGLKAAPVWGNGPRADNEYLISITHTKGGEAHNDYLSVRFNYGYVGLVLLLFGFASTFLSVYRIFTGYSRNDYIFLISSATLTLFISFLMFMYTDNILKYTIYFPNYFFALVGIVYSLKKDEDIGSNTTIQ